MFLMIFCGARDYRRNQNIRWRKCKVLENNGYLNYLLQPCDQPELRWRRHVDQLRKAETETSMLLKEMVVPIIQQEEQTSNVPHTSESRNSLTGEGDAVVESETPHHNLSLGESTSSVPKRQSEKFQADFILKDKPIQSRTSGRIRKAPTRLNL